MILKIIRAFLRPYWITLPPYKAPMTTPKMEEALIIVLYKVASSLFHPNFVLITGAT